MALVLIGESLLTAIIEVLIKRTASPEIKDFFRGQKLDEGLLKKLKATMRSVSKLLNDAEAKQITDSAVKEWLDELKDAVYEADDFLDEIAYRALQLKLEANPQSQTWTDQVRSFLSSLALCKKGMGEMQPDLVKILQSLEELVGQRDVLGLIERIGERQPSQKIPTTSLVDESGVYGRDADKEAIMKLLQSDDAKEDRRIDVIPIVGMGGIGKTTLAKLVYKETIVSNDRSVKNSFDLKAWVYVSEEFDALKVTKNIFKEVSSENCDNMTENQLHSELEKKLTEKKVLIVLDDVWSKDQERWEFLLEPFKYVTRGSKIIVTARDKTLAPAGRFAFPPYNLKELNNDHCWSVFAKQAFVDGNSSAHPRLEKLGREIVAKCKGLPLAAKILGSLLRFSRKPKEWDYISKSNLWDPSNDNILSALRLSYHYLPSPLKQCFAYCALFPKGYLFKKEELVLLWMAEGYLVQPTENKEMEEVGREYFNNLVSRSLFQQSSLDPSSFVMHDLINDLARFVSGEFYSRMEGEDSCKITRRTRHLSYTGTKYSSKFMATCDPQFLRTFLHLSPDSDLEVLHGLFPAFKRLRVLSLGLFNNIYELPNSIDKLKHLRYMDLHQTHIRELPESICCLYNLQILILYGCKLLVQLPTKMSRLINLCHVDIRRTNLQEMPSQMGKLTKLQKLTDFVLGNQSGSSIKELGKLQHLRTKLCIWNLQNVMNAQDALEANLKGKKHLDELELRWDGEIDCFLARGILEQLQPHANLRSLCIDGYGGTTFPDWVGDSTFSNIESLKLSGCKHCSLPPFGQLASLKDLSIEAFDQVEVIGPEFYGSCKLMKELRTLRFERMSEWREWFSDEDGAFPLLQALCIRRCPKLTKTLPSRLPSLTKIEIQECQELEIECFPLELFPKLEILRICSCPKLVSFGKAGLPALNLRSLYLQDCSNLIRLPECMHSLVNLGIFGCPKLESFSAQGLPSKLESLQVYSCNKLIAARMQWGLQKMPSLSHFEIGMYEDIESFPEETLLPPTLTSLEIWNLQNLKSLDYKGLQHLSSLRELKIYKCPKLQSLPEEGMPSSLSSLWIYSCPLLKHRCQQEQGDYWPKISHIPEIWID